MPLLRSSNLLDCIKLNNTFESTSFDITMISSHFFHLNRLHLIKNVVIFTISGVYVECIVGTIPFLLLFFGLCYTISKQWFDTKDKIIDTIHICETTPEHSETVVGASGVILALVSIAAILTLCIVILIATIKFIQKREIKSSSKILSKFWLVIVSCIGFFIYTMIAVCQSIEDSSNPTLGVANDVHLIGLEIGAISGLPTAFFYLFRILSWSIIRLGFNKKSKILTILDFLIGFG